MRPWEAKGSVGLTQVFGAGGADLCQKARLRMMTGVMLLGPPGRRRNWRAGCGRADGAETQVTQRNAVRSESPGTPFLTEQAGRGPRDQEGDKRMGKKVGK